VDGWRRKWRRVNRQLGKNWEVKNIAVIIYLTFMQYEAQNAHNARTLGLCFDDKLREVM